MTIILKTGFGHTLDDVRRDLDSVEIGLGRLVGEVGKRKLGPLIAEVQALMPFDPTHRGWRGEHKAPDPGHIRESITGSSSASRFSVVTTHPGGPVHWWGGTIRPRKTPIEIHHEAGAGEDFVSKTGDEVAADIESALDHLLRRHGL